MTAAGYTWDFKSLLLVAAVIVFAMILGYRLMHRDVTIWRTRFGFFIERDRRLPENEDAWPELQPPEDRQLPTWHDKTVELPPEEEKP